jgi:hypothetical protein
MIASIGAGSLPWLLGLGYLGAGVVVGGMLHRRSSDPALSMSALAIWPLLLGMLNGPQTGPGVGPYAPWIDKAFREVREALEDPIADALPWEQDLSSLQSALQRADQRLGLVDRLLTDAGPGRMADKLRAARAVTAAEIEAVLEGVIQLRLHVGLVALEGDGLDVRTKLGALLSRAAAIDEVSQAR